MFNYPIHHFYLKAWCTLVTSFFKDLLSKYYQAAVNGNKYRTLEMHNHC